LRIKRKDVAMQAEQEEELVPIRLEIDWDKIKLRDTFTWNYYDRIISPEIFAAQMVEDFGLTPPAHGPVLEQVQHQLREQLVDFYPQLYAGEEALDPELPYSAYKNEEMRILIKLNITIGPHTLEDKFEWEINNPLNSPEEFAQSLARELSLAGEFTTAIAHSIREQCQLFTRSLYIVGHPFDGRPLEDADLIAGFLPSPLPSVFRPQQQAREYTPFLYELTEADLERGEVIYSREQRRNAL
jgi:SWI/SNF-related matrix-associated actin-dependent regulator of chromatin subfamily B protein 1